jgi:hypothetical protein
VAQLGSALRSGRRGRWFKSSQPDSPPGTNSPAYGLTTRPAGLFAFMHRRNPDARDGAASDSASRYGVRWSRRCGAWFTTVVGSGGGQNRTAEMVSCSRPLRSRNLITKSALSVSAGSESREAPFVVGRQHHGRAWIPKRLSARPHADGRVGWCRDSSSACASTSAVAKPRVSDRHGPYFRVPMGDFREEL